MALKKKISLNRALLIPIITLILVIIMLFSILWQVDYRWLSEQQSSKILGALNDNIQMKLEHYLSSPLRITEMLSSVVEHESLYASEDASQIESILLKTAREYQTVLPQISVIAYGGENLNFVGIRLNDDGSNSLMLKDSRTEGMLNIYGGPTLQSEPLASYPNYDPRIRPWYAPIYESTLPQWSEIYVNYDEKKEVTISSIVPVLTDQNIIKGAMTIDVKLSRINDFLKADQTIGSGIIYIVDDQWRVIAHSTDADNIAAEVTDDNPTGLLLASEIGNLTMKESVSFLIGKNKFNGGIYNTKILGDKTYISVAEIKGVQNLGWRIISVIPESDLMGDVITRQYVILLITILAAFIFSFAVYLLLNKIIKPILSVADVVKNYELGETSTEPLSHIDNFIMETEVFIHSFEAMSRRLNETFMKLSNSEEQYRSLIENSDEMIISLSSEGRLLSVNTKFEINIGKSRSELMGRTVTEFIENEHDRENWEKWIHKAIETGEKFESTLSIYDVHGKMVYFIVNMVPIPNSNDTLLCTFSDITELINAQKELDHLHVQERTTLEQLVTERTQELEFAMRELLEREKLASLGSLVSGIAHEINTPLGVAVSAASYVDTVTHENHRKLDDGTLTKNGLTQFMQNVTEGLEIMTSNLSRAATLVNSFKQISVNQTYEAISTFKLREYLEMILISLKHELKVKKVDVKINCPDTLTITSYQGALTQVFTNLIMNALTHAFENMDTGEINIDIEDDAHRIHIHFTDHGAGISEEHVGRIFEPFFTTKRGSGGSGLGLNIVYNIITNKLEGKITCHSKIGIGTTFDVELPKL